MKNYHFFQRLSILILSLQTYSSVFAQPGELDQNFGNPFSPGTTIHKILMVESGKILICGYMWNTTLGDQTTFMRRLLNDGSIDNTFNIGDNTVGVIRTMALQTDGKIIIGGQFSEIGGFISNNIARINNNGEVDMSFTVGEGFNDNVFTISVQNDKKIIVGGDFTHYNGIERNKIVRLNENGQLDGSFDISNSTKGGIYTSLIDQQGKLYIGGDFTTFGGLTLNRIARLSQDGSIDDSFKTGTGFNDWVLDLIETPNKELIVGGRFTSYNGFQSNRIAKLNSDGRPNQNFNPGMGPNGSVFTISIQSDLKLVIGGFFNQVDGADRKGLARLNQNGTLDQEFNVGSGVDLQVLTTVIQDNAKMLIGGGFQSYNGVQANAIARILKRDFILSNKDEISKNLIYPNPASDEVFISNNLKVNKVSILDLLGKPVINSNEHKIKISNLRKGVYSVLIYTESGTINNKLIVN